jgi:signal transduction histidine kinase
MKVRCNRTSLPASQGAKDVWNLVERASRATDAEAFVRQSQLQSIDLLGLLGELVRHQQQTYSGIRLGLKGSGSVLVNADPTLLKEAVANLVANAASFAIEQSTVEILLEQAGASAIIKVRNKGPLLLSDPEVLFGPFASTRSGRLASTRDSDYIWCGSSPSTTAVVRL